MHQAKPTFEVDGAALRRFRMQAGLNIAQLAAATGISASYLSHIEVGSRRRMRPASFAAVRDHLGATTEDLILGPHEDTDTERST